MGSVPLKLKDSADFQNFSSTEENYLAYQVGLSLADADSSTPSALSLLGTDSSSYSVGFLTDTAYDSAVGTGGDGSFLTFTTTTTNLRQTNGTVSISDSDYRLPILQRDSDGQRVIREMNDSDTNALVDRLTTRIFTSDYVGTYRLGSSAPSGDYTLKLNDVMTDTRTDGASLQYNIYQRTNQTAPTQVLPFSIKRSNGDSGDYQGLQLMTPRQIKYSLGLKTKNRIASSETGVGGYKLFSSSAGTPTDLGFDGTWSSKGTATDTRQAIVDANYTRGRVSTYSRLRQSAFSADYTRTRSSAFSQNYTRTRASTYSADYTITRASNYSLGFIGNFIGNYARTSTRDSQRTRSSVFDYVGNYVGDYIGNYSRLLSYAGNYVGNYVGGSSLETAKYARGTGNDFYWKLGYQNTGKGSVDYYQVIWNGVEVARVDTPNYNGPTSVVGTDGKTYRKGAYVETSSGGPPLFSFDYHRVYVDGGDSFTRTSTRTSTATGTYTRNSTVDFLGNYTRTLNYLGNYTGDFLGEYTRDSQRTRPDDFARNFVGNYAGEFTRTRTSTYTRLRTSTYIGNYIGNFTGDYLGNFTGNYVGSTFVTVPAGTTITATVTAIESTAGVSCEGYFTYNGQTLYFYNASYLPKNSEQRLRDKNNIQVGSTNTGGPAVGDTFTITTTAAGEFVKGGTGEFTRRSVLIYTRNGNFYSRTYIGNYTRDTGGADTFVGNYARYEGTDNEIQYLGNYSRDELAYTRTSTRTSLRVRATDFTRTSTQDFTGNYARNFVGNYSRNFTRTRSSNFLGGTAFSRDFLGNYIGNYSRNFSLSFEGNYSRNFAGNYQGNYSRDFIGDYSRTFTGNYAGNTIGAGNTNIETYTLYVRIA